MTVVFCHGLESEPTGRKYQALVAAGHDVIAPDGRGLDLGQRIDAIITELAERDPVPFIVGSSFGGIAGLGAALVRSAAGHPPPGMVLCAPALHLPIPRRFGVDLGVCAPTIVIHGRDDDVIPIDVSRRFCRDHGAKLVEVDDDHRLSGSMERIVSLVGELAGAP